MSNNEALRLQELHRYKILFTEPEAAFDRITALAKRLFGVPIVLISLVDADFQWFKSCIGLNASSTSREVSFCQHTIAEDGTLIIPDATLDARFAQNALVTGPEGIRFYAGAPLISPRGHALGSLCIIDTVPHTEGLSVDQRNTLVDLAEMVVSELELRSANETLSSTKAELERSNEDLAKFAHIVSHDLQTPVRTIGSFAELLRRRLTLSKEEDRQFEFIVSASRRMGELIRGLLKYAEAGEKSLDSQDASTEEIVDWAVANLDSVIQDSKAEIIRASLPIVKCDRLQISQLVQNLIANALKYRCPERTPRILIACEAQNNHWQFRIEDNGIGIAEKDQAKIFEPLSRLHGNEIPGFGLGLAICRTIVNRHGGTLSVSSKLGIGTTFQFTLPSSASTESCANA